MTRADPSAGPCGSWRPAAAWKSALNQSAHHSRAFPVTVRSPEALGGKVSTGQVGVSVVGRIRLWKLSLPDVATMRALGAQLVAPGVQLLHLAAACSVLPLRLGGQSFPCLLLRIILMISDSLIT